MAKGSQQLNTKRDDARTLMLKIDARATYGGRERNAAYQLEGERQLQHIEVTRQLFNADLNRAKRKVQRRMDFFVSLQEQSRERKKNREIAWCEEEEMDWEKKALRAARRRQTLPKLQVQKNHKAEVVGSIRREQKREFANKMELGNRLNWSMKELSKSYAKHRALTERNEAKLGQVIAVPCGMKQPTTTSDLLPKILLKDSGIDSGSMPQSSLLRKQQVPGIVHLKNSGHRPTNGSLNKLNLARSFYMNTSMMNRQGTAMGKQDKTTAFDRFGRRNLNHDPSDGQTKKRRTTVLALGAQQTVPLRFYELEDNPFLKEGVVPGMNRSGDLIGADKADEMYVWLGFESEEEFERLRRETLGNNNNNNTIHEEEYSDTSSIGDNVT